MTPHWKYLVNLSYQIEFCSALCWNGSENSLWTWLFFKHRQPTVHLRIFYYSMMETWAVWAWLTPDLITFDVCKSIRLCTRFTVLDVVISYRRPQLFNRNISISISPWLLSKWSVSVIGLLILLYNNLNNIDESGMTDYYVNSVLLHDRRTPSCHSHPACHEKLLVKIIALREREPQYSAQWRWC